MTTHPYVFDIKLFDSDKTERVTVDAESRARAFSLAALQSDSSFNVMEVTLIKDNGIDVDRYNQGAGITSPSPDYPGDRTPPKGRCYIVTLKFILPSGSDPDDEMTAGGAAIISGRPLAFSDAVIESGAPDNVWQAELFCVSTKTVKGGSKDSGDWLDFEQGEKYGGITVDLYDWLGGEKP